jgi:hypothetical protein
MTQSPGKLTTGAHPVIRFFNPFSSGKSLSMRVASLAFYVIASVAAWTLYQLWNRQTRPLNGRADPRENFPIVHCTDEGTQTIRETLMAIDPSSPFVAFTRADGERCVHQPIDYRISCLGHRKQTVQRQLVLALQLESSAPQRSRLIAENTANLMRILFTISSLMLNEVPQWTKQYPQFTFAGMLADKSSYQSVLFCSFATSYHKLRKGYQFGIEKGQLKLFKIEYTPAEAQAIAQRFYIPGTQEHDLRLLFNDLCDRVQRFANPSKVENKETGSRWGAYVNDYLKHDLLLETYVSPVKEPAKS